MSTIAEKLTAIHSGIESAKTTLAANLRGVGVAASDTETITQLAAKVADADEWHPNPYWPSLDDIADGQIGFIVRDRDSVGDPSRFVFRVWASLTNFTVDWGDGTVQTYSAYADIADHTYAVGGGTPDGHGATTYKVRITPSGDITGFQVQPTVGYLYIPCTMLYCVYKATQTGTLSNAFYRCSELQKVVFSSLPVCTGMQYTFMLCSALESIDMPELPSCTNLSYAFYYATKIRSISFASLPICTSLLATFAYCTSLQSMTLPLLPEVTSLGSCFVLCFALESVSIPPVPKCTSINSILGSGFKLRTINGLSDIGANASSVDGSAAFSSVPASIDGYYPNAKFVRFGAAGISSTLRSGLKSLSFHPSSTFSGSAPQIDISYCDFTRQSLINLFNILPTLTSKQIKITGCTGAAELTAADLAIATGKGWTVIQ